MDVIKKLITNYIKDEINKGAKIIDLIRSFKDPVLPNQLSEIELEYENMARRFAQHEITRLTLAKNQENYQSIGEADKRLFGFE